MSLHAALELTGDNAPPPPFPLPNDSWGQEFQEGRLIPASDAPAGELVVSQDAVSFTQERPCKQPTRQREPLTPVTCPLKGQRMKAGVFDPNY